MPITTKRNTQTFEPSGPILQMIQNELRGKPRGFKTRLFERCIYTALAAKYPKLAERYDVLKEEGAA